MKKGYVIFKHVRGVCPNTKHDHIHLVCTTKKKALEELVRLNSKYTKDGHKTTLVKKHLSLEVHESEKSFMYTQYFYTSSGQLSD